MKTNGTIKFYHPDETLVYHIKKSFCKVVFQNKQHILILEIESTDELEHVEEDSLQNEFPELVLNVDDFVIPFESVDDLTGNTVEIPVCFDEKENEEGELIEYFYTNLNVNDEDDLETNQNTLQFTKTEEGNIHLVWRGFCDDFTTTSQENIKFKVSCTFNEIMDEIDE